MIAQSASPEVPFWLQILSITLAPITGFIGVAIGGLLQVHNDRKRLVFHERRQLYTDFLKALDKYAVTIGTSVATAMRMGNDEEISKQHGYLMQQMETIGGIAIQIDLMGSDKTAEIAQQHPILVRDVGSLMLDTLAEEEFDPTKWGRQARAVKAYAAKFRDAAIDDLALTRRHKRAVYDDLSEGEERKIRQWVNERETRIVADRFHRDDAISDEGAIPDPPDKI